MLCGNKDTAALLCPHCSIATHLKKVTRELYVHLFWCASLRNSRGQRLMLFTRQSVAKPHLADGGNLGGDALERLARSLRVAHVAEVDVAPRRVVRWRRDAVDLAVLGRHHAADGLVAQLRVVIGQRHHACSMRHILSDRGSAIFAYRDF